VIPGPKPTRTDTSSRNDQGHASGFPPLVSLIVRPGQDRAEFSDEQSADFAALGAGRQDDLFNDPRSAEEASARSSGSFNASVNRSTLRR
jgi:hypothetical protein